MMAVRVGDGGCEVGGGGGGGGGEERGRKSSEGEEGELELE